VKPNTVISWQRKRFRDHWARLSRQGRRGRPTIAKEVREILIQWANAQHHWVRAIVREVLATNQSLSEEAVESAYKEALAHYGLSDDSPSQEPRLVLADTAEEQSERLVIRSLQDVANVNRLAPNQGIGFNPRMTVLFGEIVSRLYRGLTSKLPSFGVSTYATKRCINELVQTQDLTYWDQALDHLI